MSINIEDTQDLIEYQGAQLAEQQAEQSGEVIAYRTVGILLIVTVVVFAVRINKAKKKLEIT
ncbi:MAG: hypothetical protein SOT71_04905 [Romboutsia timonensis]|uniref:hypothetical protein n=1 Tax=Romboutsia timonensis TaxID=1776391 RepID=UPI002A74DB11|nr:hypothetical protein [Romboutsia timonensis]MDY2881972.1 hypothetical protein [Romboutsia timonensis]